MSEDFRLVRDVIVQTITPDLRVSDEVFNSHPPVAGRVELGKDLWIGSLGYETVNAIMDACSPRGLNFSPTRQFGFHYCLVREQKVKKTPSIKWDEDRQLQDCIALSRLVHPTTISTHISARLSYEAGTSDMPSMIVPGPSQGMGAFAWVNGPGWRNWLTNDEALELARLLKVYDFNSMPIRVRRAMRQFESACLTYYPDARLALVVTGLEALVNTHRYQVAARFKKRIALISNDIGMSVSSDCAEKVYDYRSSLVHGQGLPGPGVTREFNEIYEIFEALLRKVVSKCVEDVSYSNRFASNTSIDAVYPV